VLKDVLGWLLDETEREELLHRFSPIYPDVIAHHVTLQANAPPGKPLPSATVGEIVGQVDDGRGIQALVVRIDGTTDRPDGSTYHITWSLDRTKGRRPVESNLVIASQGWISCPAIPIHLRPARF
jgi:hypothetical protein